MKGSKLDDQRLKQKLAANLAYYRKLNKLTQAELAQRISYSDKSVSKWERAEGVPDIFVLSLLCELYGISVDDFLSEKDPAYQPPVSDKNYSRFMIFLMSIGLAVLTATVAFAILKIFIPSFEKAWFVFILAVPVSCIIAVVFSTMWWNMRIRFIAVSLLVWSISFCIHMMIPVENITLIYAVSAVMQVLALLWFLFLHRKQMAKAPAHK